MPDEADRPFTAGDVRKAADLSYRQLNEWDGKGVLPDQERRGESWRRYTPRQVFALMVMAEIRKRYGVPVGSLRFVRDVMLDEGADHFMSAVRLIALLDLPVFVMTDLKSRFVMDSAMEIIDLLQHGDLEESNDPDAAPPSVILLNVNPLVRRLLRCRKPPIELPRHGRGRTFMAELGHAMMGNLMSKPEQDVVKMIRSGDFDRVEVRLKNGEVRHVAATQRVSLDDHAELADLVASDDYQDLRIVRRDGSILHVERTVHTKPSEHDGTTPRAAEE